MGQSILVLLVFFTHLTVGAQEKSNKAVFGSIGVGGLKIS